MLDSSSLMSQHVSDVLRLIKDLILSFLFSDVLALPTSSLPSYTSDSDEKFDISASF